MAISDKLTIQNKKLKKIDNNYQNFVEEQSAVLTLLSESPNQIAAKEVMAKIENLKKQIKSEKYKNEFDALVAENLIAHLEFQEKYLLFITKNKCSFEEIINLFIGSENWLTWIKEDIKNYPYLTEWNLIKEDIKTWGKYVIDIEYKGVDEQICQLINKIKGFVLAYGKTQGILPKDYDFDLTISPPYRDETFWQPEIKRMMISRHKFYCFKIKDKIIIDPCYAVESIVHEILGHSAHQENSKTLPLSLQPGTYAGSIRDNLVHIEGVAVFNAHKIASNIVEQNKKELQITDDLIKYSKEKLKLGRTYEKAQKIFFMYLNIKRAYVQGFDWKKEIEETMQNKIAVASYSRAKKGEKKDLFELKNHLYYYGGYKLLCEIEEKMLKKYGKASENEKKLMRALITGVWSWKVLPKFVDFYMREC
ncbi:MAG: hypothetical protein CVU81_01820 [Euryarchaeota archaeon HGW-Euryarchaeota-1]|nr:MAG: hypothetical protein CVU81_01820 [Euryarchaeota archaeon HGW-Euryarchaeota-1]